MSHAKNKVKWCLKKGKKELREKGKHKGLVRTSSDIRKARQHIVKAEHNLRFMMSLKDKEFSDWCGSAAFYSIYHSLLAILAKFGYESRNQECTFALIEGMAEDETISFDTSLLDSIIKNDSHEKETITEIREQYQYGTKLSIEDKTYDELLDATKRILGETKRIIEE
ncbi:MAG: HEPN domain-containing protein [Candidatus Aenigmarchaeota archaeon]|nr:HEPN domain-containing protein [Candidatus Aenigmarchaeota archaeon]